MKPFLAMLALLALTSTSLMNAAQADDLEDIQEKNLDLRIVNKEFILELEAFKGEPEFQQLFAGANQIALMAKEINQLAVSTANQPGMEKRATVILLNIDKMEQGIESLKDRFGLSATRDLRNVFDDMEDTAEDLEDEID